MRLLLLLLLLPLSAHAQLRWQEGQHYKVLPQPAPVSVPAGKIEVTEVFSYACIHCFRAKDQIRQLAAELPADAVMTYVHASFNPAEAWPMFQRAFYAAQSLGIAAATHEQMFVSIWETGEFPLRDPNTGSIRRPLPTIEDAAAFYQKYAGVNAASFLERAKSKQIDDAVKNADLLVEAYRISGTPTVLVNGRFLVMNENLGSWADMRQLVNFLVAQERRRLGPADARGAIDRLPTMHIERLWPDTSLRNYHYLVVCKETGEALAVDPWDANLVLATARRQGWTIRQILNTHHHHDHVDGNEAVRAATGARVLAHAGAASLIGGVDRGLADGDVIRVGRSVEMECLDTPGHTMSHVCLLAHGDRPALFSGDTLFNAGAGNCHNGGDPLALYETFATRLSKLPDHTEVHAGHDYMLNNLGFTLDRERGNQAAEQLRTALADRLAADMPVTTLGEEKRFNTFFRLQNPQIIAGLREKFPDLPESPSPREVFVRLRALRNKW